MKIKLILPALLLAAHTAAGATLLSEDFESYTVTGPATHANRTTLTGATVTNSVDVCSASNPFAPIGTGSQFLDVVGVNGYCSVSWTLSVSPGTVYTVSFKSAEPANGGLVDSGAGLGLTVIDAGAVDTPSLAALDLRKLSEQTLSYSQGGSYPTNRTTTATYSPTAGVWATNRWRTNSFTFTPTSTSAKLVLTSGGGLTTHCSGVFIDDLLVTSP